MPLLRDFVGQPLRWVRPRLFRNVSELRAGDTTLATLSRSGVFQSRTLAVADDQQWTFAREGGLEIQVLFAFYLILIAEEEAVAAAAGTAAGCVI